MARRHVVGIGLGALAGVGYGTGPFLFKAYVHPAGVDWIAMLMWRFALATLVSWVWLLAQPWARAALRGLDRRTVARVSGRWVTGHTVTEHTAAESDLDVAAQPALRRASWIRLGWTDHRGRRPPGRWAGCPPGQDCPEPNPAQCCFAGGPAQRQRRPCRRADADDDRVTGPVAGTHYRCRGQGLIGHRSLRCDEEVRRAAHLAARE